jgi:hypothetical protein
MCKRDCEVALGEKESAGMELTGHGLVNWRIAQITRCRSKGGVTVADYKAVEVFKEGEYVRRE